MESVMHTVWPRLRAVERRVRSGKPHTFLTNRPGEFLACAIAQRCVVSLHSILERDIPYAVERI